jgi:8-oxo-dGTP pyrophosphatase MutT (NUDIX family)
MIDNDQLTMSDFIDQLRNTLAKPESVPLPKPDAQRSSAAVLVPIVDREKGLHVVYIRRSDRLSSHRGQVAFPGGRFDRRYDPDLCTTALRETDEEIGVQPQQVEVLGTFEGRQTRAEKIFVTPFVGVIHGPVEMRPDPKEVAEIFEVPLEALHDRRYRGHYLWNINGTAAKQPAILYGGQTIWGLTYYLTLRFLDLSRSVHRARQGAGRSGGL